MGKAAGKGWGPHGDGGEEDTRAGLWWVIIALCTEGEEQGLLACPQGALPGKREERARKGQVSRTRGTGMARTDPGKVPRRSPSVWALGKGQKQGQAPGLLSLPISKAHSQGAPRLEVETRFTLGADHGQRTRAWPQESTERETKMAGASLSRTQEVGLKQRRPRQGSAGGAFPEEEPGEEVCSGVSHARGEGTSAARHGEAILAHPDHGGQRLEARTHVALEHQ